MVSARTRAAAAVLVFGTVLLQTGLPAGGQPGAPPGPGGPNSGVESAADTHHDVSPALRDTPPAPPQASPHTYPPKPLPRPGVGTPAQPPMSPTPGSPASPTPLAPATSTNFNGVGNGFSGPQGSFAVTSAPPDTYGAVGPNHYVQMVNSDFAVFSKTGTVLYGPVPTNTVWSGFGGGCQSNNDGDGQVEYDPIADRWVIDQFSVSTTPYLECVAVSQTNDPTGAYYRYSFSYGATEFPDYPKLAVWPDAYYATFNIFANGSTYSGAKVCAYDRAKMLTGQAATQQCAANTSTSYGGLLAADLDGATPPAAGSPELVVGLGATSTTLAYWKYHVDWVTPANSTFTGPTALSVPAYSQPTGGVPQPSTTVKLDELGDRLMTRLAYRRFADHESLVANHTVVSGSSDGIRWYELRNLSAPSLFQSGTYAPDSNYRWMGSIAMDQTGDIGVGYSTSSSTVRPAIRYTGRLSGDATGTMAQGESTLMAGVGSQTGSLTRWGDYSAMQVDPADDCTFWYTNEYLPASGSFNWSTRIGSFKFPACGSAPATNDFSLSVSPTSVTAAAGTSTTATVTTAVTNGSAQTVNLSVSGLPSGASASFSPTSITGNGSSTVTLNAGTAAGGTYPLTITGAGPSATHSTSLSFTVTAATTTGITNGGFETGTLSGWTSTGTTSVTTAAHSGSYAAMVGGTNPTNGDSTITQTFTAPTAAGTLSLYYKVVCPDTVTYDWATVTLKDNTAGTTATLVPKTCTNSGTWANATGTLTASHGYTLTLVSHDDNYARDPTYTLYDDVTIGATPPPSPLQNGGFETGTLSGWTAAGTTSVTTASHSGSFAGRAGSTSPTNGDSSLSQTFTAASGTTSLSLWYHNVCPDTLTYDWATATLKDNTTGTTTTVLAKTCSANSGWVQRTAAITAGHTYTLTLTNHDDNYSGDPTYTDYDDVSVQ